MPAPSTTETAVSWLQAFEQALSSGDIKTVTGLFGPECFWRDLVSFTWTIKTMEGEAGIADMLGHQLAAVGPSQFRIEGEARLDDGILAAWFRFETRVARGKGHLRLKDGKAFTLLTTILELKGHEEQTGVSREQGVAHGARQNRRTWAEQRTQDEAELGVTQQPYCVIIGGGQGGLALGARLKRLGVPALILEKSPRAGDSWRNRYKSLVLHDPVWYDHLPYLPFPEHWPVFTPKDKMGDWLECYAKLMELNVWGSTPCTGAAFDGASKTWTVTARREGQDVVLKPKQLVFATGSYGPPREITIKGQASFTGEQYHSSRHTSAARFAGCKAIVIGANSSGHDMCADFWENGANVTMIQRSPTTVVRSETLMDLGFAGLYSDAAVNAGITTETADLIFASMPLRLMADAQRTLYIAIAERDADLIGRLNSAGFQTDYGQDESGLMMKALRTGSGYYIDVGCSELIARGHVEVRSGVEVSEVRPRSVLLSNGEEHSADVIVYATGYRPMNEWVAGIISREVADRIGANWGYGSGFAGDPGPWQGELRNMWKPLAQEALWLHGGNLALSRHYSLYVALQIKARMEGIATPVYGAAGW